MMLTLVDMSFLVLHRIMEDVLVKVKTFMHLTGFVIIVIEEEVEVPIILGRQFLCTAKANVNLETGEL